MDDDDEKEEEENKFRMCLSERCADHFLSPSSAESGASWEEMDSVAAWQVLYIPFRTAYVVGAQLPRSSNCTDDHPE